MAGTAVFRMVVSSDSMKNATATSQGRRFFVAGGRADGADGRAGELVVMKLGLNVRGQRATTARCAITRMKHGETNFAFHATVLLTYNRTIL